MAEQPREINRPSSWPRSEFVYGLVRLFVYTLLAVGLVVAVFAALLWMISPHLQPLSGRPRSWASQNLKELALAMHAYESVYHRLPPAAVLSKAGEPLLSWRVSILPYLRDPAKDLFDRFKLDEPWDSPHNMELLPAMPKIYATAPNAKAGTHRTYVQAFVGKGTAFEGTQGCRLPEDFPDGASNTILLVEGGQPVPWTKPQDIPFAADRPLPELATVRQGGFYAAYADGSAHWHKKDLPEQILRALITRNGGEVIPNFD